MGTSKTEQFSDTENRSAQLFKALGHPARIAILRHISVQDACICGDLVEEIGLAQATISQHLKELKNVGLIQGTIDGPKTSYCINPVVWDELKEEMATLLNLEITPPNCC